ncbi:MAG: UDP-N-acetylmuramoyl-tripeptide--D-alanyl-D-alanine ligase [Steroidobacteraceae bacterium]
MKRSVRAFAASCAGRYDGPDLAYSGVSTDTRAVARGEIYLALRGPRFDGNEFVAAAAAAGAVAAVVDRPMVAAPLPLVSVEDGQAALTQAAAAWRAQFPRHVIGVAGSNGKTTVKEMLAAIMAQLGPCLATRGNLNNHIGVPLTLLRLDESHHSAVIEIGTNHPGEVAALVAIARPTVGLVTNAGAEHLEGFGDLDGVALEEGQMFAGLAADAVALINADDAYAALWRGMTRARVWTFGIDQPADFRATQLAETLGDDGFESNFLLSSPQGEQRVRLNVAGRHNVRNALAAAGAAMAAGATLGDVAAGLATMQPVGGRLTPRRASRGARLIDDSYNANPSSMCAGIDVLTALPGEPWLVMGEMGELGDQAEASHVEVGAYARGHGVRRLFAMGELSRLTVQRFGAGASWHADTDALARAVDAELAPGVTLLVKGSRSNRLERVVAFLTGSDPKEMH